MIAGPLSDFFAWLGEFMRRLLNLPVQATETAAEVDALQYAMFLFFWAIGVVVIGAAIWFSIRYRRRRRDVHVPTRKIVAPVWLELGLAGFLLAAFILFWVIGFSQYSSMIRAPDDAMEVYVTAKQWMWKFTYPEGPSSTGRLYVPRDRPVRLILTSRDVIHSFFVPAFRIKQDAVPGRYTSIWFEAERLGRYQLLCAEFCGAGHSRMWGEVVVLPEEEFAEWLETANERVVDGALGEPRTVAPGEVREGVRGVSLADRGERIAAAHGCFRCHTTDGTPHIGPTWEGLWRKEVALRSGETVEADPAYLTESMMDPLAKIVAGYPPLMPTYQGRLAPAETAAIVELIRSLSERQDRIAPPAAGVPIEDVEHPPPPVGPEREDETPRDEVEEGTP